MSTPLLIGNGLAMLISAYEIGRRGQAVRLLTDGKPLGGNFSGIEIDGQKFDIGMVMLEEVIPAICSTDLRTYDSRVRNDWTRFGKVASRWLREHVELVRVPTPECLFEGKRVPDYLIANRLEAMAGADQPMMVPLSDPHHPSKKYESGVYDSLTYAQASRLNHGEKLHQRFIEPFVSKLLGVPSEAFLARYHRAAWVPWYYPETLAKAVRSEPTGLAEYPFWTTPNGYVGQLVLDIREKLREMSNVTVLTSPVCSLRMKNGKWTAVLNNGETYESSRLALGLTQDRGSSLLGISMASTNLAASVSVLFAKVRSDSISTQHTCTMLLGDELSSYRLTDQDALAGQDPEWHRLTIESSPQSLASRYPNLSAEAALKHELADLLGVSEFGDTLIKPLKCITAQNALVVPTAQEIARASTLSEALAYAAPGAVLTGSLLGYGVASLNDQLVQGIKLAEEFV